METDSSDPDGDGPTDAFGPSRRFDELEDPLERLERNEKQGLQAFRYVLISIAAVVLLTVAIIALVDVTGAECPGAEGLCLTPQRVEVVVVPTLLSLVLSVLSMWKTYTRWRDHIRWRPWLFATYAMWMVTTACLLLTSSAVFVEIG